MSPPATRIALVGAGYFGQFHYDAWARMPGCEIVGMLTRSADSAAATAARFGIGAAFTDAGALCAAARPDLVDITSPPETHLDLIGQLAPHVPWLICQKPFCRDLAEARQAVRLADDAGARVIIHENFRFQPWYREIRRLMPTIAPVYQVTFRLRPGDGQGPEAYLARQPYFQQMPRFLVRETGVHWIDTFRYLMGEVTAVSADLRQLNPAIAGEDAGVIQFAFADGTRGLFDGNRLADHGAENRRLTMGELEVEGARGTLRLDGDGGIWRRAHGQNTWDRQDYAWSDHLFGGDCVYLTSAAALGALRSGEPAETEAAAYLRNLAIVEAVYDSHTTRAWVDV